MEPAQCAGRILLPLMKNQWTRMSPEKMHLQTQVPAVDLILRLPTPLPVILLTIPVVLGAEGILITWILNSINTL